MKSRLVFLGLYFIYWFSFFVFCKFIFLIFHANLSLEFTVKEWALVFFNGFKLDVSVVSYLLLLPGLFLASTTYFHNRFFKFFIKVYNYLFLVVFIFIVIIDLELYRHWSFRLDSTPLLYISKPKEMMASISFWVIIRQLLIGVAIFFIYAWLFTRIILLKADNISPSGWKPIFPLLIITGTLVVPIRGGFGVAPLNVGNAYFHSEPFLNHAAVNVAFNLGYALTNLENINNPYKYYGMHDAMQEFNDFYPAETGSKQVIAGEKPNILMIILESFNSKIIEPLGGLPDITPGFNELAGEGILFTNMFSSGDRSDKGIVSLISGYPALPKLSIIKYPQKTENLSFISHDLIENGYHCSFYYGGDIDFANMRSYLTNGGFSNIVSKRDFHPSGYNSKWGVHDHLVFERLYADLLNTEEPFFKVFFTLSSHEPFDVPMETVFKGNDPEQMFLNAAHYTDMCLAEFIKKFKDTPAWENTIVILTSDHGSRHPGYHLLHEYERFMIPMLWIGGPLEGHKTHIDKVASQTDLAKTLLNQLNIKHSKYNFSKDIFSDESKPFAFYFFNDGFGYVSDTVNFSFDNISKSVTRGTKELDSVNLRKGKSYLQILYQDFLEK